MKKAMWIISMLSLILTAVALQFLPDTVPMHYNLAGEIDRWGSKYENLIFPVIILAFSLFWHLLILHYEKKADKTTDGKERAEAASNAKVLKLAGVSMAAMFTIMQGFLLYSSYAAANTGAAHTSVDIAKVSCILAGLLFIVLGNVMPKTKKNRIAGFRTGWSMYNDTTWMKSNRFGAVVLMLAGLLTVVTTVFAETRLALALMLVYLVAAVVITLVYSYRVYKKELEKEERRL